jgi:hypothetical protein
MADISAGTRARCMGRSDHLEDALVPNARKAHYAPPAFAEA